MFEVFKKYILDKVDLTEEELGKMEVAAIRKKVRKKQYILQEGDVCRNNTFVAEGCFRLYRIDEKGGEHILRFAVENWWISDRESLNTGTPSKSNIDALEDSTVFQWSKEVWARLSVEIPLLAVFSERLLARSFHASQNRLYSAISATAEERYAEFVKTYPDIYNRVPQHMIASYLGVKRETLSRLRGNFHK